MFAVAISSTFTTQQQQATPVLQITLQHEFLLIEDETQHLFIYLVVNYRAAINNYFNNQFNCDYFIP